MIQTRLENEQFTTLPVLVSTDRLHTGFISTDRPDSSHLVDLHVYVIPKNVWKDVQHLAQNEAMDDAISAGFVRVPPNMKIRDLRDSIEQSCGNEEYFPHDFIFLRSVGRCLTRVKPKQENDLKVKNFRPPQTYAPEIYLLEGRHEDYAHIPSSSPAFSSASYMLGHRNLMRAHPDFSSTRVLPNYQQKPIRTGRNHPTAMNGNSSFSHLPSSGRQSWTKFTQVGSDPDETSPKDMSKLKEEQERLRRRQAELERMRRAAEEKRAQSERDENEQRRRRQLEQQEQLLAERRRYEQQEEAATRIQASFRGYRDRQTLKERRFSQRKLERVKEVDDHEEIPLSINLQPIRSKSRQRSPRLPTPAQSRPGSRPKSNLKIPRPLLTPTNSEPDPIQQEINEIPSRSSSSASNSPRESPVRRVKSRSHSQLSRPVSIKSFREDFSPKANELTSSSMMINTKETIATAPFLVQSPSTSVLHQTVEPKIVKPKQRSASLRRPQSKYVEKVRRKSSTEIFDPEDKTVANEIESERKEAETKRRRQIDEDEKRRQKELEEQRRRDAAKRTQREDPETLRARLQELRARRADLEKIREDVIKHLKNIHNRITLRRKEARDMWKKKYFYEKKKTPPLEDRVGQLKSDLDQIHRKTVQTMDAEAKHAFQMGYSKESDIGNFLTHVTKNHHDIQDIRHQLELAKLRLTTDIKLRNQAENECRILRHELNQAKMNLNHIKTRIGA